MSWNQWYRISSYIKSALWVAPVVAMLLEQVALRLSFLTDKKLGWSLLELTRPEAQAILQAIITMTLSFIVFTFGSLLVAVQIAGGQLTPRIIATTLLRDNAVKYSVGLFCLYVAVRNRSRRKDGHYGLSIPGALSPRPLDFPVSQPFYI